MHERGLPEREVLKRLRERLKEDSDYASGRILSSMCTQPPSLVARVFAQCLEKNLGDPRLFPATAQLELEAVRMMGELLGNPGAVGNVVSGGTEANLLALWAARKLAKSRRRDVIAPESVHLSIDRAADILGLRLIKVPLTREFQADVSAVREKIGSRTLTLVGVAGTTELGVVDPIPELSELAERHGLWLHVDAAFGGFVLPFLKELGYKAPDFDFGLPGVSSITVDPHKMGLAPLPAGGILFRDASLLEPLKVRVPYIGPNVWQTTITGTRPGASAVAVWALLMRMGRRGYRAVVGRCMGLTASLVEGLRAIGRLELVRQPVMNIVGIRPREGFGSVGRLAEGLEEGGWRISAFPEHVRVVLMPHLRSAHVREFLGDLRVVADRLA